MPAKKPYKKNLVNSKPSSEFSEMEKLPPQNVELEESILGALMIDKNAVTRVMDILMPEDFYRVQNQTIYNTLLELFNKSEPIDVLTVTNRLKEQGVLEEVGGASYLASLVNKVPTTYHTDEYAKIIHRKRILRDLIAASYDISRLALNEEEDVDSILDQAEQTIFQIAKKKIDNNFVQIKDELEKAFERIDLLQKGGHKLRGVATGFPRLDSILGGLQKSDMVVLGARPSLGKTSLALDIARNAALRGTPVGIFSLEMSKDQLVDRLIAAESTVDLWKIRTGRLSSGGEINDFTLLHDALSRLAEAPLYIDDTPSLTTLQIRTKARRLMTEANLGLLIIDYLQLINPLSNYNNPVQQYTEISRSIKALARELEIPVLVVSQLSRGVEQRTPPIPKMSDLRETGSIEQDSDVVLLLYREDKYKKNSTNPNVTDVIIAKHRNGPIGKVELYFNESITSFRELEKQDYDANFEGPEEMPLEGPELKESTGDYDFGEVGE